MQNDERTLRGIVIWRLEMIQNSDDPLSTWNREMTLLENEKTCAAHVEIVYIIICMSLYSILDYLGQVQYLRIDL